MKKSLIALTVASAAASTAYAQVDLDDPTSSGSAIYASEIDVSGTGVEVNTTETAFAEVGFSVTDATSRYFSFALSNGGNFVDDPSIAFANTTCANAATANEIAITKSAGGDGNSDVLFEVATDPTRVICNDATVTLSFNAGTDANLGLAGTTEVSYTLFSNPDQTGVLASAGPNTFARFSPAVAIGTTTLTGGAADDATEVPRLIEVADDSLNFEGGGVDTALGSLFVALNDPTPFDTDGAAITMADILTSHTVEIAGDFSAADAVTLHLDSDGTTECGVTAPVFTATLNTDMNVATFAPPVGEVGDLSTDGVETAATVCLEVTGSDVINEGTYIGTYKPVDASGYTLDDAVFTLGALDNTGTTIELNLTLTPRPSGGVYRNLIRVTNTSSNSGRVFFRMVNDAGESSPTVTLGEVTGGTDIVVSEGSSPQVNIDAIYAAVQAADPTFMVGAAPSNKLRTIVTGEFGSMDVQTYTVSTDNTTFSTF